MKEQSKNIGAVGHPGGVESVAWGPDPSQTRDRECRKYENGRLLKMATFLCIEMVQKLLYHAWKERQR